MFQILTQEGWIEVMDGVIEETETDGVQFLCAIYFILYHQFVTVVSRDRDPPQTESCITGLCAFVGSPGELSPAGLCHINLSNIKINLILT